MLLLSDSVLNATPDLLATDMVLLARTRYAGVNHTHLSELLRDREGIDIRRNTLRKILTDAGVNSPRRRRHVQPPSMTLTACSMTTFPDPMNASVCRRGRGHYDGNRGIPHV